jgi:hypothetical protein
MLELTEPQLRSLSLCGLLGFVVTEFTLASLCADPYVSLCADPYVSLCADPYVVFFVLHCSCLLQRAATVKHSLYWLLCASLSLWLVCVSLSLWLPCASLLLSFCPLLYFARFVTAR